MQKERIGTRKQQICLCWMENAYCKLGILNFGGILQSFQVKTPEDPVEGTPLDFTKEKPISAAIFFKGSSQSLDGSAQASPADVL